MIHASSLILALVASGPPTAGLAAPGALTPPTATVSTFVIDVEGASPAVLAAPTATASAAVGRLPQHELDARFTSVESSFRAQRSALGQMGVPLSIEDEPNWLREQHRPAMEELSRLGSMRATAWLLRHFSIEDGGTRRAALGRKLELYTQLLDRNAGAEWLDSSEIDVFAALLADAPLLGEQHTRAFAELLLLANPERFHRRAATLRACARAILGVGKASEAQRLRAADLWRDELARSAAGSPMERYATNELWRLENFWIGDEAPGFAATDVDGNEIDVRDFRSRVLVVAFFELDSRSDLAWVVRLRELARRLEDRPLAILGVETGTGESAFRRMWEEHELRFPCVFETSKPGRVASAWRLNDTPRCLIFDGAGRLRHVGVDGAAFDAVLDSLLDEPPLPPGDVRPPTRARR